MSHVCEVRMCEISHIRTLQANFPQPFSAAPDCTLNVCKGDKFCKFASKFSLSIAKNSRSQICTPRCWVAVHLCVFSHFRRCDVHAEVHTEKVLELCVRCACVQLIFGRAMCDCTFTHFYEQMTRFPVLELFQRVF